MGGEGNVYTLSEVSEHNKRKDCWLVIEGQVKWLSVLCFNYTKLYFVCDFCLMDFLFLLLLLLCPIWVSNVELERLET